MENILQSLVKIIIIGALYEKTNVDCNRQFLPPLPPPPPLPYYQNDDYYLPGFAPPFHNQPPTYYPEQNLPSPTSYQNVKSYASPQLFYQNENYIPPPLSTPGLNYPPSQLLPYKQGIHPHKPQQQKVTFAFSRVQYKNPPPAQAPRPQQHSHKKTEAFASNIIVKEEPLYPDDYSKTYNEEDYTDTYLDDSPPPPPKPCSPNDPYRYFEAPKGGPSTDKTSLCHPYFQPNFGNSVYTLKVPITLLPSRFPPRVEQLIERIQNYFSTYTQQQAVKPQNETAPASSTPAPVETPTQTTAQPSTAEPTHENNDKPPEIQQETTAGVEERITERTTVATAETKDSETASTAAPEPQGTDGPQREAQTTPRSGEATEHVQAVGGTFAEANAIQNQPPQEMTPAGGGNPHSSMIPEQPQPMDDSSSTTTTNQNLAIAETNGSFQANDSNNG